jgi:hypothetical protein
MLFCIDRERERETECVFFFGGGSTLRFFLP